MTELDDMQASGQQLLRIGQSRGLTATLVRSCSGWFCSGQPHFALQLTLEFRACPVESPAGHTQ